MNQDPQTLERDIERTQDAIGDTIDKIEEKLNPSDIVDSLVSGNGADNAKTVWRIAKENPVPVALIAIGAGWLFATSQTPMIRDVRQRFVGNFGGGGSDKMRLRPRSEEPAPIGPPPPTGETFDRRAI
jgi:hypothetical protein